MAGQITESDLLDRISKRSEYAWGYFLTHVGLDGRIADAVWFNPSAMTLTGFEVKCSRGDWVTELKDPWKSYAVGKFCDRWYLVVSRRDIVRPGELPTSWGLMVAEGSSTKILQKAPKNPAPAQWDRELISTLLKKIRPPHEPDDLAKEYNRGWTDGHEKGWTQGKAEKDNSGLIHQLEEYEEMLRVFKEKTGVSLDEWNVTSIASDLALLQEMRRSGVRREAMNFVRRCENAAESIRSLLGVEAEGVPSDGEAKPVTAEGAPEVLREIAQFLIRYETPLRRAAATLEGLEKIVNAPLPTISDGAVRAAAEAVAPVARLLGAEITVGLTRRVARIYDGVKDAKSENKAGHTGVAGNLLPGGNDPVR